MKRLSKKTTSEIKNSIDLHYAIVKKYIECGYSLHSNVYIGILRSIEITDMSIQLENAGILFRHDKNYWALALNENETNKQLFEIFKYKVK